MALPIEQDVLIDAPVGAVWRAVTEPAQITKWFADEADLEATPEYEGTLTFHYGDRSLTHRVTVREVEPERVFSYRWTHPAGGSTLVEFTFMRAGTGTRLAVVEAGVEETGWPPEQQYRYSDEHNEGWMHYFGRLHDHLAGGR